MSALTSLGLLDDQPVDYLKQDSADITWAALLAKILGCSSTLEKCEIF